MAVMDSLTTATQEIQPLVAVPQLTRAVIRSQFADSLTVDRVLFVFVITNIYAAFVIKVDTLQVAVGKG